MPKPRRRPSPLCPLLAAACLWGCIQDAAPPVGGGPDHEHDGAPGITDGGEEPLYPRAGWHPPIFSPTPPPRPIAKEGTVVGIWDISDGTPSRDGTAVRHALSAMGIPSEFLERPSQLPSYKVAVLTGDLTNASLPPATVEKIDAALRGGATILAVAPRSDGLDRLAGIAERDPVKGRRELRLQVPAGSEPLLRDLHDLAVSNLTLADMGTEVVGQGYRVRDGQALALFEDGSAALVRNGSLYVFGLRAQYHLDLLSGLDHGFEEGHTNRHFLQGDLWPLLLRRLYLLGAPQPRLRRTAPDGHRAAVVLTHDCDSPYSAAVLPAFLAEERRHGVKATYLVATSSYANGLMGITYNRALIQLLRGVLVEGFEVGSHSFGHFLDWNTLPARRGDESAANYLPRYENGSTVGGSLFGEVQISRQLLELDLQTRVAAFRPGYLIAPPTYYDELQAGGYLRSSARAGGIVRTNFPYRAVRVRPGGYEIYPIIEYPLAISDRGLDGTNVSQKVAQWVEVVERNSIVGAPTILLLHPSSRPGRVESLSAFLEALQGRDLWVGDWRTFAEFYESQGF